MRQVEFSAPGGPEVLFIAEAPRPVPGPGEVLVRVAAAGVNRPDIQQRRGLYPAPPSASPILGLDVAGVIEAIGPGVTALAVGQAVCALANGGGYAEYCLIPAPHCMPLPKGFSFVEAASLPEVYMTAWNSMIWLGRLGDGETLLVQGGTSGVGLAAIQIARQLRNTRVIATVGTSGKGEVALGAGASHAVSYRDGDWADEIVRLIGRNAVDLVLDGQAGPYTQKELDLLAPNGRVVLLASHLGAMAEVNVREIVRRRLTLAGSVLRPQTAEFKGRIAAELVRDVWPLLEDGRIVTRIHATFPLAEVREAHRLMDANEQIGKVVLVVDPALADRAPA